MIQPKSPRVFRHFIREWIKYRGLNQARLAGRMEVAPSVVSRLLSGKMSLTDRWLAEVAHSLECDVGDLFRDPARPTCEELLSGLSDSQIEQVIQIVDVLRRTGAERKISMTHPIYNRIGR